MCVDIDRGCIVSSVFDVFSVNGYRIPLPPDTVEIARRTGKPVLLGEFHFGALDRGLHSTGAAGVSNQENRGVAYRYYVEQGFTHPEVIGMHWTQWWNQFITGRYDGENYQIGFMDICHQPCSELIDAAKAAHENMYKVATGEKAPYDKMPEIIPEVGAVP